jgi:hypothetical protein
VAERTDHDAPAPWALDIPKTITTTRHSTRWNKRDVWQVLKAHVPFPGWESDAKLKTDLAHRLMALADAGVRNPAELRAER